MTLILVLIFLKNWEMSYSNSNTGILLDTEIVPGVPFYILISLSEIFYFIFVNVLCKERSVIVWIFILYIFDESQILF